MNSRASSAGAPVSVNQLSPAAPITFRDSAAQFSPVLAEMARTPLPPLAEDAPRAAVLVTPWVGCPLAWFAITLGHFMRCEGVRVTFVWNDLCDAPDANGFARDNQLIKEFLARVVGCDVVALSAAPAAPLLPTDAGLVSGAARSNAIWNNRGSLPAEGVERLRQDLEPKLLRSLPHVRGVLMAHPFEFVVVPGGMYGCTGLFAAIGAERGVRVSSYDSGKGLLLIGVTGPAACQLDVARCVRAAPELLGSGTDAARAKARDYLEKRRSGGESYFTEEGQSGDPIQMLSANDDQQNYRGGVVIPLNVEWDTAAVGLHRFYRDDTEWLKQTVAYLLEQGDVDVTVRQHPATRVYTEGAGWMKTELTQRFGHHPRFRFIGADERVNTYRLLAAASVVLPLSSTVGVEAAMLGRPVVMESHAYYAGLPFAPVAEDEASYFARILERARGHATLPPEQVAAAELTYFFAVMVNPVRSPFTPTPDDFPTWCSMGLDQLRAHPAVEVTVAAFVAGVPAAALQLEPPPAPPAPPAAPAAPSADVSDARAGFKAFANVTMGDGVQIIGVANVEIGAGSCIGDYSWLNVCERDARIRIRIGINVLIGRQSMVSTGGYLEIGDYCLFGPRCSVVDADHGVSDIMRPYGEQTPTLGRSIVVEENCWLGAGAVIAGHLTIGRGSVIGANSLVTKDVEPFSIVVGSPARLVKLYDPVTKQWERADNDADVARVEAHRRQVPLPERTEYRQILRRNSRTREIVPIVAGRGEWL